jgi:hypothetical protein
MATGLAIRAKWEPLRSIDEASIGTDYVAIGIPFANPVRIMWLQNTTDVLLTFSQDGVDDNFILEPASSIKIDLSANRVDPSGALYFSAGESLYVKGEPTMGSVYLSVIYGTTIS